MGFYRSTRSINFLMRNMKQPTNSVFVSAIFTILLCVTTLSTSWAVNPDTLLKPEEAFKLSVEPISATELRVRFDIVDGYYLYKHRFNFSSASATLASAIIPEGKKKHDEFFGDVETFRQRVDITVPFTINADHVGGPISLIVGSQGCADAGLCYPPQKQTVSFEPLAAAPTTNQVGVNDPLNGNAEPAAERGFFAQIGRKLGFGKRGDDGNPFLPPDEAFILSVDTATGKSIDARWTIADGYYLYREKFAFKLLDGEGATLGTPHLPNGEFKVDESFGRMEVYHRNVSIGLPVHNSQNRVLNATLEVTYQGCAEAGFCYPPITKTIPITLAAQTGASGSELPASGTAASPSPIAPPSTPSTGDNFVSDQDQFAQVLADGNFLGIITAFYIAGILLAFTPCVFPMIPILSSIVVGQGVQVSTSRAFWLSLSYVLAMAFTYTLAGIAAGKTGENLQAVFQSPWILITFSAVFVALAFSMFGFYDLQIPNSWQSKLTSLSNKQRGGTLTGAGVMGFLSALIVGPCVAAPLIGALIYIGQKGDAFLGGAALFALSMGMGTPLLLIGTSAGKLLPRAGGWMNTIKAVFGVLLLAVALWMLGRILPGSVTMILWAVLAIVSGVYLGALRKLEPDATGWTKLWQGSGVVLLTYGVILMIGAAAGGSDPLQPLRTFSMANAGGSSNLGLMQEPSAAARNTLVFKRIKGLDDLEAELAAATRANKTVMLDFYADWCVSCKEMEHYTFTDPGVQAALADTVLLQADVTANDDQDKALLKKFGLFGPPSILFFDSKGNERSRYRVVGFMKPVKFRDLVLQALAETQQNA